MKILLLLLIFIPISTSNVSYLGYQPEDDGLSIPENAVGAPTKPSLLFELERRHSFLSNDDANKCYCSYGKQICDSNMTCIKKPGAACFHAIEEVYNKKTRSMETWHKFGCATLEKGSGASHFTCNSWRSPHHHPKSIACCQEGRWCNKNIEPPPYSTHLEEEYDPSTLPQPNNPILLTFFAISFFFAVPSIGVWLHFYRHKGIKKDHEDLEQKTLIDDSGSGSKSIPLNQRTVAQHLAIIEVIGRGRYGEVRKANYKGRHVAVKTIFTTDEESWKNEREIYQTQMLNHENILQYVASDICSEQSITQMLLITDYHELGSLCDYLRRDQPISEREALQLAHSILCGLEHLHSAVHGTGGGKKPEIAHRDIKSKNIIVKRKGVCCIADFGLAVRFEGRILPEKVKVQVGTKRYMAPEVLAKTLHPASFEQFKMADMYSVALVLWEITRRTEVELQRPMHLVSAEGSESGYGEGDSTSGDSHPRIKHMQKRSVDSATAKYALPFEGMVGQDPSIEDMKQVVVIENRRPPLEEAWKNGQNKCLHTLSRLMENCWYMKPIMRYSALKVKLELGRALKDFEDQRTISSNSSKSSHSSGIHLNTQTSSSDNQPKKILPNSQQFTLIDVPKNENLTNSQTYSDKPSATGLNDDKTNIGEFRKAIKAV